MKLEQRVQQQQVCPCCVAMISSSFVIIQLARMKQARHQAAARWPLQLSGEIDKMAAEQAKEDDDNSEQVIERKPHIADEVIK